MAGDRRDERIARIVCTGWLGCALIEGRSEGRVRVEIRSFQHRQEAIAIPVRSGLALAVTVVSIEITGPSDWQV